MVIRLVIKDKQKMIVEVGEMERYRKDGKRDLQTLEMFLNKAHSAISAGLIPCFEFPDAYLPWNMKQGI